MSQLSDEFLLAYLDGQLEKTQASSLARIASGNAEVSRRLQRLRRTQTQMLETFGAYLREHRDAPAEAQLRDLITFETEPGKGAKKAVNGASSKTKETLAQITPQKSRPWRQLAFVAAVFVGGLLGGYSATLLRAQGESVNKITDRAPSAPTVASWAKEVAKFHAFFPKETLTFHPDAISSPELIRFQLTKVTAKALTPPDFSRQGYTLFHGQTFNYNLERMMQLTYTSKTDPVLTLYVLPAGNSADTPMTAESLGSNSIVSWTSDRVRFLLTAEKNVEDLKVLAVLAQTQMPRKN